LRAALADCDRHVREKADIVKRANSFADERDEARLKLAAAEKERDRLAEERADVARRAADAASRAASVGEQLEELRRTLASKPDADSLAALWAIVQTLATKYTKIALAWLRGKIPPDHPALPWFDRVVETATSVGCLALNASCAFVGWAKPQAIKGYHWARAEIEKKLQK
jgi:hypothetical protein